MRVLLFISLTLFCLPLLAQEAEEGIQETETEISVKNAEIASIVRVFSKKTKRNYILDERVKGKVTIFLPGKVSAEESLRILESVLMLKGFTSVPIGENLWKIIPAKDAKQTTIPTVLGNDGSPASPALVTRLLSLKYVSAEDMQQVLQPLVSPDGLLNAYGGTNSLIIIDSEENIRRLEELVSAIDIASSEQDMTMIPIKNAEAQAIADKLIELLGLNDSKGERSSLLPNKNSIRQSIEQMASNVSLSQQSGLPSPQTIATGQSVSPRTRSPKILADERTNSLIIVADEETTARIKALVSQLDSKVDKSGNRFYVYRCQHAKAEDLAQVLSGLSGGTGGSSSRARLNTDSEDTRTSSLLTGNRNRNSRTSSSSALNRIENQSRRLGESRLSRNERGIESATLGENISITAEPSTNSLIISAGRADYEKILELLKQIDIKRRQVLVEATLLEVQMTDQTDLGMDFLTSGGGKDGGVFAQQGFNNLAQLIQNPGGLSGFTAAVASSGTLTIGDALTIPSQAVLVRAAQSSQNANVLSAPKILTTDNEQAEIVVGQNVPFVTSTSRDKANLDNTFNQIERQDVGITLRLTPQISSENFVTLKLFTEVSSVVPTTVTDDKGPITNVRTSETTVIAKDGQMIVIGGLLSDDVNQSTSGVPFLKDIPVLGHLFKDSADRFQKRNLLIFITPRIVRDQFDARDQTKGETRKMEIAVRNSEAVRNRDSVLKNPSLDAVTEIEDYTGEAPSAIKPPEKSEQKPIKEMSLNQSAFPQDSPGVIQLKVQPKLKANSGRFIILSLADNSIDVKDLPFRIENGETAVEIPEGSKSEVFNFFAPGRTIEYKIGDRKVPFTIVDSTDSKPAYVHILSPFEVMNLGKGPWQ